jgi:hypothetical protein
MIRYKCVAHKTYCDVKDSGQVVHSVSRNLCPSSLFDIVYPDTRVVRDIMKEVYLGTQAIPLPGSMRAKASEEGTS